MFDGYIEPKERTQARQARILASDLQNKSVDELVELRKHFASQGYTPLIYEVEQELHERGYFCHDDYICLCKVVPGDNDNCLVHGRVNEKTTNTIS
jgi:hypothetical protein